MAEKESVNDRIRRLVAYSTGAAGMAPADEAVLDSLIHALSEDDIEPVLTEFFDVEPIVLKVYNRFVDDGGYWDAASRYKLAEALFFHGLDMEAPAVHATLYP